MSQIGFIQQQRKQETFIDRDNLFLQFDSGAGITFPEACYNSIILGSTGAGKTSCAILPAIKSLLENGNAGLVIDIKGNVTDHLRTLASTCGRESDIIEYGSGSEAIPVNILEGLELSEVQSLFKYMATKVFDGNTGNMDWHLKGVRIAVDCLEALRYAQEKFPTISPDIQSVESLINDYEQAANLWSLLKNQVFDPENKHHSRFQSIIEQEQFHVLSYNPKKGDHFMEQTTWRLNAIRNGLDTFQKAPGIMRNFSAPTQKTIDLKQLIYDQKRVVVLRFGVATSEVGSWLSRHILERFYKTTFEHGLSVKNDEYTFMVADEAQEFIDLSPSNRMNDNSFAAKAREYRVIQVVGTQSVAALASRGARHAAVCEYLNNFNNRIHMYCDDPLTLEVASRSVPAANLVSMGPGECAVTRFTLDTRRHVASMENLQQAHDMVQSILQKTPVESVSHLGTDLDTIQMGTIQMNTTKMDTTKTDTIQKEAIPMHEDISPHLFDAMEQAIKSTGKDQQEVKVGKKQRSIKKGTTSPAQDKKGVEAIRLSGLRRDLRELVKLYPHFFTTWRTVGCRKKPQIPSGWVSMLAKALKLIHESQLDLDIDGFGISDGYLYVTEQKSSHFCLGLQLCNTILRMTQQMCPACGAQIEASKEKNNQSFCATCLEKNGLQGLLSFEVASSLFRGSVSTGGL